MRRTAVLAPVRVTVEEKARIEAAAARAHLSVAAYLRALGLGLLRVEAQPVPPTACPDHPQAATIVHQRRIMCAEPGCPQVLGRA